METNVEVMVRFRILRNLLHLLFNGGKARSQRKLSGSDDDKNKLHFFERRNLITYSEYSECTLLAAIGKERRITGKE